MSRMTSYGWEEMRLQDLNIFKQVEGIAGEITDGAAIKDKRSATSRQKSKYK